MSDFEDSGNNVQNTIYEVKLQINGLLNDNPIATQEYPVWIAFRREENARQRPSGFLWEHLENPETVLVIGVKQGEYDD
jgi:hypothetical protein